jgi:DNA invertase Pin-like site-specific DNA recombinase
MTDAIPKSLVPAAQYMRMSDEHQRYSLANQSAAISRYAQQRGFEIVQTYADEGKTGLKRKGRRALNALLEDIRTGQFSFKALLILDVSRWGRYQNVDESAHYEFMCWEAGIDVRFCVEPFENDGSPGSSMIKHIKRIMAAEYVRELSERLRRAKHLKAQLGHHTGSVVVFGLRRELLTFEGKVRLILQPGERKAIATDRMRIVHGPPEEVATVKEIFRLYVRRGLGLEEIARRLRDEARPHPACGDWTGARVRRVLQDEAYTGVIFYGRTWQVLRSLPKPTPRSTWTKVQQLPPIVSKAIFGQAQARFAATTRRLSTHDVAERLKRCLQEHGRLSAKIILACPYTPSIHTIERRFGGLRAAYACIGYEPGPNARNCGRGGTPWNEDAALACLQAIVERHGYINIDLIRRWPGAPQPKAFVRHLGGLPAAYAKAGLDVPLTRSEMIRAGALRHGRGVNGPALRRRPPRKPAVRRNPQGERFTDAELVELLKGILSRHGYLDERLIQEAHGAPTATFYRKRFGTLLAAYAAAGYAGTHGEVLRLASERRALAVGPAGSDKPAIIP